MNFCQGRKGLKITTKSIYEKRITFYSWKLYLKKSWLLSEGWESWASGCSVVIGDRVCGFVGCWDVRLLVFAWVVFAIVISCVTRVCGVARVSCVTRVSGVWGGGVGSRCSVSSRSGVGSWNGVGSWGGVFVSVGGWVSRVCWVRVCWDCCRVCQNRCKKRLKFGLSNEIYRKLIIKKNLKHYITIYCIVSTVFCIIYLYTILL